MTAPFTPQPLAPSASGQLSNTRGTNTGADAIGIKTRYSNPKGVGMPLSLTRIVAKRSAQSGNPIAPQQAWDSGWMGAQPAVQALPAGKQACGGNATVQYNNRIYFMASDGTMQSAPAQGPAVGQWRIEQPIPRRSPTVAPVVYSIALVANRIYVSATVSGGASDLIAMYMATVNADGTLTSWIPVPAGPNVNPNQLGAQNYGMVGGWDGVSATGWIILWNSNTGAPTATFTISIADGSVTLITYVGASGPGLSNGWSVTFLHQVDYWTAGFIAKTAAPSTWHFFLIGTASYAGAATAACVQSVQINPSTGLPIGAAYVARPNLPLARSQPAVTCLQDGTIYVIGGSLTLIASGGSATVYINTAAGLIAATAWTTSAQVIPVSLWAAGLGIASQDLDTPTEVANLNPCIVLIGGQDTASAAIATCREAAIINTGAPHDLRAWVAGAGTAALVGSLGTGAALVANQDGTQDVTVNYGAAGTQNAIATGAVSIAGFVDGDQVTLTMTHVGTDGDYSPPQILVLKIGQAPSITAITPTGATSDGRPNLSFSFNPGVGGGLELSYQIQLKQGATVLFDSGVRYDGANSIQSLLAPYLVTATVYTVLVNVSSTDTPMTGSSASSSNSTTFTPTLTAPGIPTGLTVTPNNAGGFAALAWTNNAPAGTTPGNRVYYRKNGTSTWFLLFDSAAAITALSAMDRLALATSYDFAVSQVDSATHSESALSVAVLNKIIDPVAGGYSAFLHIQGSNTSVGNNSHNVALLAQDTPDTKSRIDMRPSLPFQQLAPIARFGVANYSELKVKTFIQDLAHLKSLQDVINTSYSGFPLVYRDGFGAMIVCSPEAEAGLVYKPPLFREIDFGLLQIPDTAGGWSVVQGSAQGYQSQTFGSAVPLDPSELIL